MLYSLSYERWLEKYTAAGALTVRVADRRPLLGYGEHLSARHVRWSRWPCD